MQDGDDYLIFTPNDVDLARSPLRRSIGEETFVLGAFNPGLTRLPDGNLLLMVRVAEALVHPVEEDAVRAIRWTEEGYTLDRHRLENVDMGDPRFFTIKGGPFPQIGLTSLSWLLPVELDPQAREVRAVHYDRAVEPSSPLAMYGLEDPRISHIEGRWYMTVCSASAERHATMLYISDDAVNWRCQGLVLDHQNKDMLLFEGKVDGLFFAATRPLGENYLAYPCDEPFAGGPSIQFAQSPDALHWKPCDRPGIRARRGSSSAHKVGGGAPPIRTDKGWIFLYHGVEPAEAVGVYRTFWALLDAHEPARVLRLEDQLPLIEASPDILDPIIERAYMPTPVVFSTGIIDAGDHYIVASGEGDLACRITHIPKDRFA